MIETLELLYPAAPGVRAPARRSEAARLARFLEALVAGVEAAPVVLDPERAVGDLADQARGQLVQAIEDLLRHHLHALLGADSFLWFGATTLDCGRAWSRLEAQRGETTVALPAPPEPGESPLSVARRLAAVLGDLGVPGARCALWRARIAHCSGAPDVPGTGAGDELSLPDGLEFLADRVAAALDRRDVGSARQVLARAGQPAVEGPQRLADLARWVDLLADPWHGARLDAPRAACGPVPSSLVELRTAHPELLAHLAGAAAPRGRAAVQPSVDLARLRQRATFGAIWLEWVRFDGAAVTIVLDAEPGASAAAAERRRGARPPWELEGTPENELLRTARPVVRHALPTAGGRSAVSGAACERTLALALAPCSDERGALLGWLRLEWSHGFALERAALEHIARAGAALLARPCPQCGVADRPSASDPTLPPTPAASAAGCDTFELGVELVRSLGIKLQRRRWWLFLLNGESEVACVAGGGSGLLASPAGGGSALTCARFARGTIVIDEPACERTLTRDAASALIVPIELARRTVAWFVCESEQRRDFRPVDAARWSERLGEWALALHLSQFGAWHRQRFGGELTYPARSPAFAARAARVLALARAGGAVAIWGPPGSGKRICARWLHFLARAGPEQPFARFEARPDTRTQAILPDPWPKSGGTLLIAHAEHLSPRDQAHLLSRLEEQPAAKSPRCIVTLAESPASHASRGELSPALALRLERSWLALPALADRRDELFELVPRLLARIAREHGLEPAHLTDDALACLWRQPWAAGLVELENALHKLALDREGEEIDEARLRATLEVYGGELLRRLPSRHPRRADVEAALWGTRRENGRWNKTRAALYLGWDPDTLVARWRELELDQEGPAHSAADALAAEDGADGAAHAREGLE